MSAIHGAVAAMAASAMGNLRPRPIDRAALRQRTVDGSYPIRSHRTCAELIAAGAM